jgi:shikimate dehydrogenase
MFVADVIAGHGVTPFMQTAHKAGCPTSDGVGMVEAGIKLMSDFLLGQQSAGRAANR